jgi:hypothetical protein
MIIEEEDEFFLVPYRWKQDEQYVYITLPAMDDTFDDDCIEFTINGDRSHIVAKAKDTDRILFDVRFDFHTIHTNANTKNLG